MLATLLLAWTGTAAVVVGLAWGHVLGTLAGRLILGPTDPED